MATSLYDWLGKRTYAQSGEDVIAWGELKELKESRTQEIKVPAGPGLADSIGYYVEVGAYHPKLFSNTYLFYKKGWRGICIEPNPRMKALFRLARPRDLFLNFGVGKGDGSRVKPGMTNSGEGKGMERSSHSELDSESRKTWMPDQVRHDKVMSYYYMFEDGAVNTFSVEQARKNQEEAGRKLIGRRRIPVLPLKTILDRYLPRGQKIDLLSVDAEGMDLEVLRSNDWKKYRPEVIIAEDLGFDLERDLQGQALQITTGENDNGEVVGFLREKGYRLVAKTPYSVIFPCRAGPCPPAGRLGDYGFDKSNPYKAWPCRFWGW